MNRRAFTRGPVRDNTINTIARMRNGYPNGAVAWHYRRRFVGGEVYTGVVRSSVGGAM